MNPIFNYQRRATVEVNVGGVLLGGKHAVRVQSMTNTNTDDIEASVAQCRAIAEAGGEIVRLTAQGVKEADNIGRIRSALRKQGCQVPLVADIHFNPKAAFAAAAVTDKVRINPGNFVDPARTFKQLTYTDEAYEAELQRIHDALVPFIALCREHHTAVRLGVNHGSLSDRIMSRYGNTAKGMVESVMEFLRVMVQEKFFDVVISMKASNVVVMVEAVRRVVAAMDAENMHFPLHLGVTEAGFGEDGRIKSAVGIGCLMAEGLGDTIRVSLSEDPELEIPVARKLVDYVCSRQGHTPIAGECYAGYDALLPQRRPSHTVMGKIGGGKLPVVVASCAPQAVSGKLKPDFYFADGAITDGTLTYPLTTLAQFEHDADAPAQFVQVAADATPAQLRVLKEKDNVVVVAAAHGGRACQCECAGQHPSIAPQHGARRRGLPRRGAPALQRFQHRMATSEGGCRFGRHFAQRICRRHLDRSPELPRTGKSGGICLCHFASSTPAHHQNRVYFLPKLWAHNV